MAIYDTARDMCEQRRDTVDEGVDLAVLLSVLGGLSRLTEVRLDFRLTAGENDWLNEFSLFFQQMTMSEKGLANTISEWSQILSGALDIAVFPFIPSTCWDSTSWTTIRCKIPI
jgi:hypothetical protein